MDNEVVHERSASMDDFNTVAPEPGSIEVDTSNEISFRDEVNEELGRVGELLTRVELDLACSSEKLVNLSILTMHVSARESDFESFTSETDSSLVDSAEKAMTFDLLTGILDSEVKELDMFISRLQVDIVDATQMISSFRHLGATFLELEKKLQDSEESLKQSQDQVSDIKEQCASFQKILACHDHNKNVVNSGSGENSVDLAENVTANIRMQTAEEQRNILTILEKSLAREMDLEKKLTESRQMEEELKLRLLSSEQEVFEVEEEAADVYARCFGAENSMEILTGISKDLLAQQQKLQFHLNNSIHRESEVRAKLNGYKEKLDAKESLLQKLESSDSRVNGFLNAQNDSLKERLAEVENKLILSESEVFTLREIVTSLENQVKEISELENSVEDLKEQLSKAEIRAENAEAKCKLLDETNIELNEELGLHRDSSVKLEALEKQLKESDTQLQHAIATAEANKEKQTILHSTIEDMEVLIEDLKMKVAKSENRAENAERKGITLSESNAELRKELGFLKGKVVCLEASLIQAEDMKTATAKDIGIRTKLIANLITQLAAERERLHLQMSALARENNTLIVKLKKLDNDSPVVSTAQKPANAGLLNFKHVSMALVVVLISVLGYFFHQDGFQFKL